MASKVLGRPIPTFTIKIMASHLDETDQAAIVSRHINASPIVVNCGDKEVVETYPQLTRAAEAPVIDTSCTALLMLARAVHEHGYKVALTGEGSDEYLAGYGWFKTEKLFNWLDLVPGLRLSQPVLRGIMRCVLGAPKGAYEYLQRIEKVIGAPTAYQDIYSVVSVGRQLFYSRDMFDRLDGYLPYNELVPDLAKLRRWHPLNRSLYWGARIHLPGHLLSLKGDRVAMNSSVETRYPFLDEDVYDFLANLHPRWKLKGFRDKYLLRKLGERWLPYEIAWRPKYMFRAPRDSFFLGNMPKFVRQLVSEESLRKTGYFDPEAVTYWRRAILKMIPRLPQRSAVELGLVGVVATQMWHHVFIDSTLADIPGGWSRSHLPSANGYPAAGMGKSGALP